MAGGAVASSARLRPPHHTAAGQDAEGLPAVAEENSPCSEAKPVTPFRHRTRKSVAATCAINHTCLRNTILFSTRNQRFLEQVTSYLEVELFTAGQEIITSGDYGEKMYFLHRGAVEVLAGPGLQKVAELQAGSVIGEMALFGQGKRTATVRALEFCDCRVIEHRAFQWILRKFPEERRFFAKLAEERMAQLRQLAQPEQEAEGEEEEPGASPGATSALARPSSTPRRAVQAAGRLPMLTVTRVSTAGEQASSVCSPTPPASARGSPRPCSSSKSPVAQRSRSANTAACKEQPTLLGSEALPMIVPMHMKLHSGAGEMSKVERLKRDNAVLRARVEALRSQVLAA